MANGDKAAAKGLTVFLKTQLVSKVFDYLNIRGDELAALMDRVTKVETNAKIPPTKLTGAGTGGSGTVLKSITENVAIPAKNYDRMAFINFQAVVTDNYGATDITLRKNASDSIRSLRVLDGQTSAAGAYWDLIPANTAVAYRLAAENVNPNGTWTVSGTNQFTSIQVVITQV